MCSSRILLQLICVNGRDVFYKYAHCGLGQHVFARGQCVLASRGLNSIVLASKATKQRWAHGQLIFCPLKESHLENDPVIHSLLAYFVLPLRRRWAHGQQWFLFLVFHFIAFFCIFFFSSQF